MPAAQFLRPPLQVASLLSNPNTITGVDSRTGHAWACGPSTLLAWPIAVGSADAGSSAGVACLSVTLPPELGEDGVRFVQLLDAVRNLTKKHRPHAGLFFRRRCRVARAFFLLLPSHQLTFLSPSCVQAGPTSSPGAVIATASGIVAFYPDLRAGSVGLTLGIPFAKPAGGSQPAAAQPALTTIITAFAAARGAFGGYIAVAARPGGSLWRIDGGMNASATTARRLPAPGASQPGRLARVLAAVQPVVTAAVQAAAAAVGQPAAAGEAPGDPGSRPASAAGLERAAPAYPPPALLLAPAGRGCLSLFALGPDRLDAFALPPGAGAGGPGRHAWRRHLLEDVLATAAAAVGGGGGGGGGGGEWDAALVDACVLGPAAVAAERGGALPPSSSPSAPLPPPPVDYHAREHRPVLVLADAGGGRPVVVAVDARDGATLACDAAPPGCVPGPRPHHHPSPFWRLGAAPAPLDPGAPVADSAADPNVTSLLLWSPGGGAVVWEPAGGLCAPVPLHSAPAGGGGGGSGWLAVLAADGGGLRLPAEGAAGAAAGAAAGSSPLGQRTTRAGRAGVAGAAAAAQAPPPAAARSTRARRAASPSPDAPGSSRRRTVRGRGAAGGAGDASTARPGSYSPAAAAAAPTASAPQPTSAAAVASLLDAAVSGAAPPAGLRSALAAAGCLDGGPDDAVGAYVRAVADALPKHWGGSGGARAAGAAGPDAALAAKAATLAALTDALEAGGALASLHPTALRTLGEAGERVAAVAAVRAAVNDARTGPSGLHPAVSGAIAAAGAAAFGNAAAASTTSRPPEEAFYAAPVKAAAALLVCLPAQAASAARGAGGPASPPERWAALAALTATVDAALEAARAHRAAWRASHPAAAALALRGDGTAPDWLSDVPARAALGALSEQAGDLLPAALSDAPYAAVATVDLALTAAERLLDAHARAAAAASAAAARPAGREAFGGGAVPGEYEAAAARSLRPPLAALPALASAADPAASAAAASRIEGLAAAHGAWGVLYEALRTDPPTGAPLPRGADRLYARMASAAAAAADADVAAQGASFAEFAFARLAGGPTPSELLELPATLNTPLAAWLAARGPRDAAAARLRWLHDVRRRRYGDAAATLLGLALPGGGGGLVGVGAGDAPGPEPTARAAAAAKLAALASTDPWPGGDGAGCVAAGPTIAAADAAAVVARAAVVLVPGASSPPPAAELAELALTGGDATAPALGRARSARGRGGIAGRALLAAPRAPDPLLALELVGAAAVLAAWAGPGGGGGAAASPPDLRRLLEASFARLGASTDWTALATDLASASDDARRAALASTPLAAGTAAAFADPAAAALYTPLLPVEAGLACALDGAGIGGGGGEGASPGASAADAVHGAYELGLAGVVVVVEVAEVAEVEEVVEAEMGVNEVRGPPRGRSNRM